MKALASTLSLLLTSICLHADIISQWNFNSVPPDSADSTGTLTPSVGYGAMAFLNGVTNTFSAGSTNDPATGDDSAINTMHFPPQATSNKTAGVQFNASTIGYSNIVIRWDQRTTSTASKYFRLQYSSDGTTFTDYPTPVQAQAAGVFEGKTNGLSAFPSVNNNSNFAFRIVAEWESTAANTASNGYVVLSTTSGYSANQGNVAFDYVTITGTPIPGSDTPPYISSIGDQTIRVSQSTGPISFTVLDAEDAASNLVLNAISSDPTIIAPGSISFGGNGSARTVNVTAGSQPGSAIVEVWVIDSGGKSNGAPFTVTVLPANTAPVISAIPATNTLIGTGISPLAFTIGDAESPAASLVLSASSQNSTLVPNANVVFGGSDSNRTVSVTPASGQIGVAPITVTVSDGTNSAQWIFGVMVRPSAPVLVYEPFDYADGSVVTNSGNLWSHHTGTMGECQVINDQLQVTTSQTEDIAISLPGAPYAKNLATVLYTSFKVNFQALPKNTPDYFAAFLSGSSQIARVYANSATNAPAGTFRLAIANASSTNTAYADDLNTNTSYTIVTRYNIDTATTTMWLNPAAESDPGVTASDPLTPASVSSFLFRQGSGLGATILIDDLRVGLSFASVTSSNSAAPGPIPLVLQRFGSNIVLTWTNPAFSLQSAPTMNSSFSDVPSASSPYTNPITGTARFFRLKAN